jgi:hypothetical protein
LTVHIGDLLYELSSFSHEDLGPQEETGENPPEHKHSTQGSRAPWRLRELSEVTYDGGGATTHLWMEMTHASNTLGLSAENGVEAPAWRH